MSGVYKSAGRRGQWKAEEFDGLKPTVYDWVRMAAFIDGEGCIQINPYKKTRKVQVRIVILNTNEILPLWLQETFGGHIVPRFHSNPKWKTSYTWSCTAGRACWILYNCLPWFLLKSSQAKLLMELQEHIDSNHNGKHKRVSEEDYAYRDAIHSEIKKLNAKGPRVKEN
jgi:hypothetical protein